MDLVVLLAAAPHAPMPPDAHRDAKTNAMDEVVPPADGAVASVLNATDGRCSAASGEVVDETHVAVDGTVWMVPRPFDGIDRSPDPPPPALKSLPPPPPPPSSVAQAAAR